MYNLQISYPFPTDLGKKARTSSWHPQALTGLAISGGTQKIEVSVALEGIQQKRGLDIRVDGEVQYFLDKSSFWQNFKGNVAMFLRTLVIRVLL